MTDFETFLLILIIPAVYAIIYIAGKYDLLQLLCDMLTEETEKIAKRREELAMEAEAKELCAWCKGKGEYTIIDDDFGQPLRPSMVHYCFNCGRKLREEDHGD